MKLLIDTNRYSDFARGDAVVVEQVRTAEQICIPFVVLAELRAGFLAGTRPRENQALLIKMLLRPSVKSLYPDADTTHHYASIYLQTRKQGTPIPANDLWIAALAVQHELVLFTRDRHFENLPQIPRI
jgi:tRNA(fMet)-specific endonuclease VapC